MSTNQINFNQFNHCPFLVFCKDQELNYTYYNNAFKALKDSNLGNSDDQLPWDAIAKAYQHSDKLTLENGFYQGIEPLLIDGEIKTAIVQKSVLRDDNNQITGLMGFVHLIDSSPLSSYSSDAPEIPLAAKTAKHWFNGISMREFDVMYYLVRGHSAIDIAERLDLSKRTVDYYINSAKARFRARSKAELIHGLIQKGFAFFVPQSLMN